ncbi:MAG: DUF3575 domain-containing protein [Chitinophagaceae bacterium]|nr:DUF3575 domain-containing protein [Chitinophagaceae bacterium]
MIKYLVTLILAVFLTISLHAQDTVYFQRNPSKTVKGKKRGSSEANIIKLSPISFLAGFVPVYYERELNSTFSIQVGVGFTTKNYLKDWVQKASETNNDIESTTWSDGTVNTYQDYAASGNYKNIKPAIGFYVSAEPRVYFANEGLDGSFIGLSYSIANYKSNANKVKTGPTTTFEPVFTNSSFAEKENISDLLVTYGYQTLYDKVSLEYNMGLGLRTITGTKYAFGYDASNNFIDGYSTLKNTKLGYNLSIKLGYHF